MNLARYFLLPDGRLRAAWRFLIFLISWLVVSGLLGWVLANDTRYGRPVVSSLIYLTATVFVTWAMLRVFDRRSFADVGLGLGAGWRRLLGCGALTGLGTVAAVAGLLLGGAGVRYAAGGPADSPPVLDILAITAMILLAASFEEMLFRGYPFQRLVEGLGAAGAVAVSSIIFGIVHWSNPSATPLSVTNTMLAGVLLSLGYLRSQSLWYPIGWHAGWNWSLGLAGFPVSGLDLFDVPWSASGPQATAWLHGGGYGPEGGAVATLGLAAGIILLVRRPAALGCQKRTVGEGLRGLPPT